MTSPTQAKQPSNQVLNFRRSTIANESQFYSTTVPLSTSQQDLPPIPVPAFGFLRGILVHVVASGGAGSAVGTQDSPFNALSFNFTNSTTQAAFYGPLPAGLFAMLSNKYGGYRYGSDPRSGIFTPVQSSGNFEFYTYIPIEILKRSGLGSISNLNAAVAYQLQLAISPVSTIYSTAPTTLPSISIDVTSVNWAQPQASNILGEATTGTPPDLGAVQFWSLSNSFNVNAGAQTLQLTNLGYYLRNLIFIWFVGGSRSDSGFPNPFNLYVDGYKWTSLSPDRWRMRMFENFGYNPNPAARDAVGGQDTGVYVYDFTDDFGLQSGGELRNAWLPTIPSELIEIDSTFVASGTLYVLQNSIAVAGNTNPFLHATL